MKLEKKPSSPMKAVILSGCIAAMLTLGVESASAAKAGKAAPAPETALTEAGSALRVKYEEMLKASREELLKGLPKFDEQKKAALLKAQGELKAVQAGAEAAQSSLGKIQAAKALVEHAKGKWIGGADKDIAKATAALNKATTEAEKEAAKQELAKCQANREEGVKALKERQAALDKVSADGAKLATANQTAQAALAQAIAAEKAASGELLGAMDPIVGTDKMDAKLVKGAVIATATPGGLAEFAQQGKEQEALVNKLLADVPLMKQMLEAGGAKFGKYGRAMEIYTAIQKASPKSSEGNLQRLALATSLEHARPVKQSNPETATDAPDTVDPVKRYQHYEKAFLAGELDPAFKGFSVWEYRKVVACDAPDEILAWGREMLRNYRPDHIYTSNYGWRYSATVRTEVPYGSQNVKCDLPSLHNYQNIIKDGGICGRRAFFGRFILQSFGIPTWGVTQHAHAALSHWTPKGWLVNLGAGYNHSWWDKDEVPRSGADFLLETQARTVPQEYWKVLRAQWVSYILGEEQYNDRRKVAGGFWSGMAHYQAQAIATAAKAQDLGPLGQELAEANESKDAEKIEQAAVTDADRKVSIGGDGVIRIPAVAHDKAAGRPISMKSYLGGLQLHCIGGFTAEYAVEAPKAGKYLLSARVVTAQEGQKFQFATGADKVEVAVPYTIGKWDQTKPVEVSLVGGKNNLQVALAAGSRGVSVKEFTLTPLK